MNSHFVVLYIDHKARSFTLTARMRTARLPGVMKQTKAMGFIPLVLAHKLSKTKANSLKTAVRAAYEYAGYLYVPRPAL